MSDFDDIQASRDQEALIQSFGIAPMRFHFMASRQAMIDLTTWYIDRPEGVVSINRVENEVIIGRIGTRDSAHRGRWPIGDFFAWTEHQFEEQITTIIKGESK